MRNRIIILIVLISSFLSAETFAMQAPTDRNDKKVYIDSVCAIADSLYRANNKTQCFSLLKQVIDFYYIHKEELIMNNEICKTVFHAYVSYTMLENPIAVEDRIYYLSQALNIIELNSNWIKSYANKQHIVNEYVVYIGHLTETGRISDAQNANQSMLNFAEEHYKLGLIDVIFTACTMNSLMKRIELNYPLYKQLYELYNNLDKKQQYRVVKGLIHFEFEAENYDEVISLATKHTKLIQWANDDIKDVILDIISTSFEMNAFAIKDSIGREQYSEDVNDAYLTEYNWIKTNNKVFLPRCIISWAYYKYNWTRTRNNAILLFYELLDILQNKNIEEPLFDKYCEIEEVQQAIISIIVTQIYNSSSPIDLKWLIGKYQRVFNELINSKKGEYYNDLINALENAYIICYGENAGQN